MDPRHLPPELVFIPDLKFVVHVYSEAAVRLNVDTKYYAFVEHPLESVLLPARYRIFFYVCTQTRVKNICYDASAIS